MKRVLITLMFFTTLARSQAGELNIVGNSAVASNLTAQAITLGGQTRTNWPSELGVGQTLSNAVVDTALAAYYALTLTTNVAWEFQGRAPGRTFTLKVIQDSVGGWTNAWGTNVLWAGGLAPALTTQAGHWDVLRFVDDGERWLGIVEGKGYRIPCQTNCSYALQFDGSQNYVTVANDLDLGIGAFTLESWVWLAAIDSEMPSPIISKLNPGTDLSFYLAVFIDGKVMFAYHNGSGYVDYYSTATVSAQEWYHLAVVFDGTSTLTFYINGVSQGVYTDVAPYSNISSGQSQWIGGWDPGLPWQWHTNGKLDELRLSRKAQYSTNFTPTTGWETDSDVVAYWHFDDGDGTTLTDETNNHDGTLVGSPAPTWVEGR